MYKCEKITTNIIERQTKIIKYKYMKKTTKTVKKQIASRKVLIDRIFDNIDLNITKASAESLVSKFLIEINRSLIKGEEIMFLGHFTFKTVTQQAKIAMNLQTKKKMNIPAKRVPKAKFSADLKSEIAKKK